MSIVHTQLEGILKKTIFVMVLSNLIVPAFGGSPLKEIQIVFENHWCADSIMILYPGVNFERVIPLGDVELTFYVN